MWQLMMWTTCISREWIIVDYTNIGIDDESIIAPDTYNDKIIHLQQRSKQYRETNGTRLF
jgi:hypothetical protein